jgi:membrane protein required for colicin V production
VNWIDLTLLAVFALFGLRGYFRGLFRELFSLIGLVVGFLAAARYGTSVAGWAAAYWDGGPLVLKGAAFVLLFFVVYFLFSVAGWLLHRAEKVLFLQSINRVGGIAVGIGKGAALVALLVFFLSSASWMPRATRERLDGAYLAAPLSRLGEEIVRFGKDRLLLQEGDTAGEIPGAALI